MENNQQKPNSEDSLPVVEDEINLLDLLLVLVKSKKFILGTMVVVFVLTSFVTLLMPNIYTATTKILPPQESKGGGLSAMLSGMGDLAALAGISAGSGGSADLYIGLLQSRRVADSIIERFHLMEKFDWKSRMGAYSALAAKVKVTTEKKGGFISVSVDDEDPQFAADLVNAYVDELKKLNTQITLSSAGRERLFLEERLALVKIDLVKAEERLREFQKINKAIKIDAQATAVIEGISRLKGEVASREVELGVLLTSQTEQNPEVRALREGLAQLKAQLRKLEDSSSGKKVSDIFIATSDVPDVGLQYARLLRDFKIQETLFELLTKQYEVAKITEAKDSSPIQVLDAGIAPDKKSKPKRSLIVLLATFASGFVVVFWSFVRAYSANIQGENQQRWIEIKAQFFSRKS